jgi:hypothetical protein
MLDNTELRLMMRGIINEQTTMTFNRLLLLLGLLSGLHSAAVAEGGSLF